MRLVRWLGCGVWAGSWYLMYLEITRWHHVKPSLALNPPPAPEGAVQPRPGLPLKLLYVACAVSPLVVMATFVMQVRGRGGSAPSPVRAPGSRVR